MKRKNQTQISHFFQLMFIDANFLRIVYFLACCFNTVAMMTSCVVFVMLVFLPCSSYIGRYHIMAIIILGAALLLVNVMILLSLPLS